MGQAADDMQDAAHHRKIFSTRRRAKSVGYRMTPDEKRIVRWLRRWKDINYDLCARDIARGDHRRPTPGRTT